MDSRERPGRRRGSGWSIKLPTDYLDERLSPIEEPLRRPFLILLGYGRSRAYCWPSNEELEAAFGLSRRHTQTVLARLEAAGHILRVMEVSQRNRRIGIVVRTRIDPELPAADDEESLRLAVAELRAERGCVESPNPASPRGGGPALARPESRAQGAVGSALQGAVNRALQGAYDSALQGAVGSAQNKDEGEQDEGEQDLVSSPYPLAARPAADPTPPDPGRDEGSAPREDPDPESVARWERDRSKPGRLGRIAAFLARGCRGELPAASEPPRREPGRLPAPSPPTPSAPPEPERLHPDERFGRAEAVEMIYALDRLPVADRLPMAEKVARHIMARHREPGNAVTFENLVWAGMNLTPARFVTKLKDAEGRGVKWPNRALAKSIGEAKAEKGTGPRVPVARTPEGRSLECPPN